MRAEYVQECEPVFPIMDFKNLVRPSLAAVRLIDAVIKVLAEGVPERLLGP